MDKFLKQGYTGQQLYFRGKFYFINLVLGRSLVPPLVAVAQAHNAMPAMINF